MILFLMKIFHNILIRFNFLILYFNFAHNHRKSILNLELTFSLIVNLELLFCSSAT